MKNFLNKYTRSLYTNLNKKLYIVTFVIVAIALIWTILSNIFGKNKDADANEQNNTASLYKPSETVISGKDIKEEVYEEEENIIKEFIDFGNNGKAEEAYNLLSDYCKDIIFNNSLENFKNNYFNELFETKREFNLQSWITNSNYNTYRVRMIDDIMSTGNYSDSDNFQDYITVVKDENGKKLNVKGLVFKKDLKNKEEETEELKIKVESEIQYVDYYEYEFSVKNKTDKKILLDTLEFAEDTMYIEITGDKKRSCTTENLSLLDLMIDGYMTKNVRIKYNQVATDDIKTKKIYFKHIIKDWDLYNDENTNEYNEGIMKIIIDL